MNELFYGKEVVEKRDLFKQELLDIERKNIEYFQSRLTECHPGHDLLHYHYTIYTSDGRVTLSFKDNSDLREDIKEECIEAFKRVFKV